MPYIFNRYYPVRNILFFLGEGGLIFLSLILVYWFFKGTAIMLIDLPMYGQQALLVTVIFQLCLYFFDLYELRANLTLPGTATRVTQAFGVGCIVLAGFYYLLPTISIPTRIFWTSYFILYLLVLGWRASYYYILQKRLFVQKIAIIGTGQLAEEISRELEERYDSPYSLHALVGTEPPRYNPRNVPVYGDISEIHQQLEDNIIDRIVVALDDRRGKMPTQELLAYKLQGIEIDQGISFYENLTAKIFAEKVDPSWIFFSDGFLINKRQRFFKRIFDILFSFLLLVLALPIMVVAAVVIKLESPGPIFYMQERVGRRRQIFKVIKFRSMVQDAEKNGAVWATTNDSRVTRFGGFCRKSRVDELPQLFNVIKGEMSMVGPRPERPVFVEQLKQSIPFYDIRHDVRPGVTGWAQVCYPYGASEEDSLRKLEYDLYYMKNMALPLDFLIIFKTIKTVLFAKGGR